MRNITSNKKSHRVNMLIVDKLKHHIVFVTDVNRSIVIHIHMTTKPPFQL
jgi:hypothetical protein